MDEEKYRITLCRGFFSELSLQMMCESYTVKLLDAIIEELKKDAQNYDESPHVALMDFMEKLEEAREELSHPKE